MISTSLVRLSRSTLRLHSLNSTLITKNQPIYYTQTFYSTNNNNNDKLKSFLNQRRNPQKQQSIDNHAKQSSSESKEKQQQQEKEQENTEQEDNDNPQPKNGFKDKLLRNAISLGAFGLISLGVSTYLAGNDDTEFYIKNLDMEVKKLTSITDYQVLLNKLQLLSSLSQSNSTLQQMLSKKEYTEILLNLILDYSDLEINFKASDTIKNSSEYITDTSIIPQIMEVGTLPYIGFYVKKNIGVTISRMAQNENCRIELANNGALELLEKLYSNKIMSKEIFRIAILQISYTAWNNRDKLKITDRKTLETIELMAKEEGEIQSNYFELKKRELIQSGKLLYLHTSLGGFVWGCFESIRAKLPVNTVVINGVKNAIITAAIPIYFVGYMTTLFTEQYKKMDTTKDKFILYFSGCLSLFPWYYLLPVVERFSPYWIGGHVLGFMSFFTYLAYTKSEIFKSDQMLILIDQKAPKREVLIKMLEDQKKNEPTTKK
ncbi:hypothetical protein DLAC_07023 [Tieghemostelium lacteum]|uniref:Transmembrane protein n=1 Tax=Tieghemostelium lacteum TaxID=361077 RepID=A0A151ZE42_TIELA|nr:hypothetical protein DLAC_07023 [Tieghemostelium lacteum]|eukprot:KYQ92180.1 hypothetical protein DLAC_07023 [Tieghemostelium lacteum]